jgi:hypothetical protein
MDQYPMMVSMFIENPTGRELRGRLGIGMRLVSSCGHRGAVFLLALVCLSTGALRVFGGGTECLETVKLVPFDLLGTDSFGSAVALDENVAVVGAPWQCSVAQGCGAAYIYRLTSSGWMLEQKLLAPAAGGDLFGSAVAVQSNRVVVGANRENNDNGAVYVYRFNGASWTLEQRLVASDGGTGRRFGASVDLTDGLLVVGAPSGVPEAAYVFRFDGNVWLEEAILHRPDAGLDDGFGVSLSISGNTVLVGAPSVNCVEGDGCGAASVFRFDGSQWVSKQTLFAPNPHPLDTFGFSLSLDGDSAIIGVNPINGCVSSPNCGTAYVYRRSDDTFVLERTLTVSDAADYEYWRGKVALKGDFAAVGTYSSLCKGGGPNCGAVYLFRRDGSQWSQQQVLRASDGEPNDFFRTPAISGTRVLAGASGVDCPTGGGCGAVYIFDCLVDVPTTSFVGVLGAALALSGFGGVLIVRRRRRGNRTPTTRSGQL